MIRCELHDYIEIACTFRYPVRLTMRTGEVLDGVAVDTRRDAQGEECIAIRVDGAECLVVLDKLANMKAGVQNPHFDTVFFD